PDVEAIRDRKVTGCDQRIAAPEVTALERRDVDCDALDRISMLDRCVVNLDASDAHDPPGRFQPEKVAAGDAPRPERSGRAGADAAQAERAVDIEPGCPCAAALGHLDPLQG